MDYQHAVHCQDQIHPREKKDDERRNAIALNHTSRLHTFNAKSWNMTPAIKVENCDDVFYGLSSMARHDVLFKFKDVLMTNLIKIILPKAN